jgi:hypothetical protein
MTPSNTNPNTSEHAFSHDVFVRILQTAVTVHTGDRSYRFARQAALAWLTAYPGDLPVNLIYAQILNQSDHPEQALIVLDALCQTDPEYLAAVETKLEVESNLGLASRSLTEGWVNALGGDLGHPKSKANPENEVSWSQRLRTVRQMLTSIRDQGQKDIDYGVITRADAILNPVLAENLETPLVASIHLQLLKAQGAPQEALRSLGELYYQRWPNCLQCILLLADTLMGSGDAENAVALLHQAATLDVTGQAAIRLWGQEHPYRSIWPQDLVLSLDMPIPAEVAYYLGWNRLPDGRPLASTSVKRSGPAPGWNVASSFDPIEPQTPTRKQPTSQRPTPQPAPASKSTPESLRDIQDELERVAERLEKPGLARSEGRYPVYVVLTTKTGIKKRFGAKNASVIDLQLRRMVSAIRDNKGWNALLLYADEGRCFQNEPLPLELPPAKPEDPWSLKLALHDLDAALGKNGQMIGALLIVGGPDVVPFHCLPNPVDDIDVDVPSDNPYATRDENYFVPEWPVGRLPDGVAPQRPNASTSSEPLMKAIKAITASHKQRTQRAREQSALRRFYRWLTGWLIGRAGLNGVQSSFGYTAAVWRRASLSVFSPIGEPRAMRVSPPAMINGSGRAELLPAVRLGYFNLHGLVDAVEWFGQSDPLVPSNGKEISASGLFSKHKGEVEVDYPVALRPEDVLNSGRAPQVVFTEACYGAHIIGKTVDEAISLKFMQAGSQAVVGSTCIAYGSISPPLISADLLGHAFWSYIRKGVPAGEALRRAKIALAREMHTQQGYLDGEDQKTLISFVLYGDPLAQPVGSSRGSKAVLRPMKRPRGLTTVCDRLRGEDEVKAPPPEVLNYVKSVVEQYLPGMANAEMHISQEHIECQTPDHQCPTGQLSPHLEKSARRSDTHQEAAPRRQVVTLSKQVGAARDHKTHHHYARLTFDEQGKLVKLVVSR